MIAQEHQTIIDLAIQCTGSAEAAFEMALLNGLSLTDDVVAGMDIETHGRASVLDVDVLNYFTQKGICPATAIGVIPELVVGTIDSFISYDDLLQNDEVIVLDGQNFIDLATVYCGSADMAGEFALLNEMAVTETLEPGMKLKKPAVSDKKVQAYFKTKNIQPATDIDMNSDAGGAVELQGIGYWIIETDFIIL